MYTAMEMVMIHGIAEAILVGAPNSLNAVPVRDVSRDSDSSVKLPTPVHLLFGLYSRFR